MKKSLIVIGVLLMSTSAMFAQLSGLMTVPKRGCGNIWSIFFAVRPAAHVYISDKT